MRWMVLRQGIAATLWAVVLMGVCGAKEVDPILAIGKSSYLQANQIAAATGEPQAVVYVFGRDQFAEAKAWVKDLKTRHLPHIVDLDRVDDQTKQEVLATISHEVKRPFLHTVHATGSGYGPIWRELDGTTPVSYVSWLASCQTPYVGGSNQYYRYYTYYNYTYYNYRFRGRRRR